MSAPYAAKGTLLKQNISGTQTSVALLINIKGPGMKPQVVAAPTLDQAGAGIPMPPTGYTDGGKVSASGYLDPAATGVKALTARCTTPAIDNWSTQWSDAAPTTWSYSGTLTNFEPDAEVGALLKYDIEVTVNGLATGI
jgi:hypothetical protein